MEGNFLNQNPCMPSRPGVFQFGIFWVSLWMNQCVYRLEAFFDTLQVFFNVGNPFGFWLSSLRSHTLLQNRFASFASCCRTVVALYPLLDGIFISLFWKGLFCLYCLVLFRYFFSFPSFASTFWFISSSCIFCCSCVCFSSLSQLLCFLS